MKFGPVPVAEAVDAIAAHTIRAGGVVIKKGRRIGSDDARHLREGGITETVVARLEPGDVGEDEAAYRLARALAGPHCRVEPPFTGRSNLFATGSGILVVEAAGLEAINAVDEAITAATLAPYKPVVEGEMVGTVKIIPYGVDGLRLDRAVAAAAAVPQRVLRVAPYVRRGVAVVSTMLPGFKPTVIDKTLGVLRERLAPAGAAVLDEARVPHEPEPLALELERFGARADVDLVVVFGASAIADRRDVIPLAIEGAGGVVRHFGMPVDPGNLLLLGELAGKPVIGAPGCARSPKENGFDWILNRLLAGLTVTRADIVALGAGGLLMEIVSRGQPRAGGEGGRGDDE